MLGTTRARRSDNMPRPVVDEIERARKHHPQRPARRNAEQRRMSLEERTKCVSRHVGREVQEDRAPMQLHADWERVGQSCCRFRRRLQCRRLFRLGAGRRSVGPGTRPGVPHHEHQEPRLACS